MADEAPLYLHQVQYAARLVRREFAEQFDEGCMDLTAFRVAVRGAGANMSVDVSAGSAIVAGDDQSEQGSYSCRRTSTVNVVVGAAPGTQSRYDLVCLRINDPDATGPAGNNFSTIVVPGTVAASPVDPAVPNSAIVLASIGPILPSTTSITAGMILDRRPLAGRKCTPGTIEWSVSPVVPNGWLACNGQAVSRTTYARLFATISTTHGVGDGSGTFNVPNFDGRTPVGVGTLGALGATGGAATHTLTQAQLPAATITIDPPSTPISAAGNVVNTSVGGTSARIVNIDVGAAIGGSFAPGAIPLDLRYSGAHTHALNDPTVEVSGSVDIGSFPSGNLGSGNAHNNLQPYLALNAIVRT